MSLANSQPTFLTRLHRYPVLLAVDELQALYGKTLYRDQHFVPIHSYHLSMPRLIMEYVSGKRSFVSKLFKISAIR